MLFPFYHLIKNPSVSFPTAIFVHKVDSFPLPVKTVINLPLDCLLIFFSTCSYFLIKIWNNSLGFVDSHKADWIDKYNWVQAYLSCPAQTWKRVTQCIWGSLDSCVFLPPACEPAAWYTVAFLTREETFSILPLVSSLCVPPRPFAFLVSMSIHRVLWKQRLCHIHSLALQTALQLGRKAQPSCEWEGEGAGVVASQGARWHLGCSGGLGQRGSPWAGGTVRAATHLVSIEVLCEDEDCCIQDFFFPPPLFWSRFCCIHAVLQTIGSVHRLQQLYFHTGLTGAVFWGVSMLLLKQGWWEYGGWSSYNCSLSCLFDFLHGPSALFLFSNQMPCVITVLR